MKSLSYLLHVSAVVAFAIPVVATSAKEPEEAKPIMTFTNRIGPRPGKFLPDARLYMYDGAVWNIETRKRSYSLEDAIGSRRYEFSQDKKYVATLDKFTALWDLEKRTATRINNYKTDYVEISPDSCWLATYDMTEEFDHPRFLKLWNIKKKSVHGTIPLGRDGESPLIFSKDSRFLYYATSNALREVSVEDCTISREVKKSRPYLDFWFLDSSDRLYANCTSGEGTFVESITLADDDFGKITPVLTAPARVVRHGNRMAVTGGTKVSIYDRNGKLDQEIEAHEKKCNSVAFSPDDKYLLTGGADWRVRLWDAKTLKSIVWMRPARTAITHVAFSADGKHFAICADTTTVWELRDLLELAK